LPHPPGHRLVVLVGGAGEHDAQVLITRRPSAVLRRAGALTVDAGRPVAAGPQDSHLVLPAVTEVVEVGEAVGQLPQAHPGLVLLPRRGVGISWGVRRTLGHE